MDALARDARARLTNYPWDMLNRVLLRHPLLVLRFVQRYVRTGARFPPGAEGTRLLARLSVPLRSATGGGMEVARTDDDLRLAAMFIRVNGAP